MFKPRQQGLAGDDEIQENFDILICRGDYLVQVSCPCSKIYGRSLVKRAGYVADTATIVANKSSLIQDKAKSKSPVESSKRRREGVEIGVGKATSLVIGNRGRALCRDAVAWLIDWTQNPEPRMGWRLGKAHCQAAEAEVQSVK